MKKVVSIIVTAALLTTLLAGCMQGNAFNHEKGNENEIYVITREEGSGTRDAFTELTGVLEKGDDGTKSDNTTVEATVLSSTQAVISNVMANENMIGYISLGSLNNLVKPIKVNGVLPTSQTIKDGSYSLARPFNIAVKDNLNKTAKDFINYILSNEGQKIVDDMGYVSIDSVGKYKKSDMQGVVKVAGSSSVSPVMEKIAEEYEKINPKVNIEIQTTDSSSGMTAVSEDTCDIGMASRELKDSEKEQGLNESKIAMDGITVIVNTENKIDSLTVEQIKSIYTGSSVFW